MVALVQKPAYTIAMQESSRGCASAGVLMPVNNSLYIGPLKCFSNERKREIHYSTLSTNA